MLRDKTCCTCRQPPAEPWSRTGASFSCISCCCQSHRHCRVAGRPPRPGLPSPDLRSSAGLSAAAPRTASAARPPAPGLSGGSRGSSVGAKRDTAGRENKERAVRKKGARHLLFNKPTSRRGCARSLWPLGLMPVLHCSRGLLVGEFTLFLKIASRIFL